MSENNWNDLPRSEQDIWSLTLDQLEQIITHINIIIINKAEELSQELESTEQERDEAMDSSAEDNIQESKTSLQGYTRDYIAFLMILSSKLQEYKNDMADTFQVKDINRKIYLDYFELDAWIKELEEDLGINSEYINNIVNDDPKLKEWETQREKDFSDWCDFNDGGFLKSDREEEKKYDEAKKIYQQASDEIQVTLKFQDELDSIIKNVSKTKGIKDIEDAFVVEELVEIIERAQRGDYTGIEKVKVAAMDKLSDREDEYYQIVNRWYELRNKYNLLFDYEMPDMDIENLGESNVCTRAKNLGDSGYTIGPGLFRDTEEELYIDINQAVGGSYSNGECVKAMDIIKYFNYRVPNYMSRVDSFEENIGRDLTEDQRMALLVMFYNKPALSYDSNLLKDLANPDCTKDVYVQDMKKWYQTYYPGDRNMAGWYNRIEDSAELYFDGDNKKTVDKYREDDPKVLQDTEGVY